MKIISFLAAIVCCAVAAAQVPSELDYKLEISEGGIPLPGGNVTFAMVVTADWWTDRQTPFVVRMTVPAGLVPVSTCTGELHFDATARVVTWSDRLDNPYIALNSCPLIFRVDPTVLPGTELAFEATLSPSAPDRNPSNNAATHFSIVRAASDLEVTIASDVFRYRPGTEVTYTVTFTNHGPQDAHQVVLNYEVSPHALLTWIRQTAGPAASIIGGSSVIPVLRVGESATFQFVTVTKTDFEAADVRFGAEVHSPNVDLHEHDNRTYHWTFAGPEADLALTSEAARVSPKLVPVTIQVTNSGPDTVTNATVFNALHTMGSEYDLVENVRILSVTPSQGSCTAPEIDYPFAELPPPAQWIFDCHLGTLAPGATARIDLVIERITGKGPMYLSSVITPRQNDAAQGNNVHTLLIEESDGRRRSIRK